MKKALTVVAAAATLAVVSLAPSDAEAGRRHGGAALLGGLAAGAIIGGAIVSQQPAYGYYGPGYAPGPVYVVPQQRYCEDEVWSPRHGDWVLRRFPC